MCRAAPQAGGRQAQQHAGATAGALNRQHEAQGEQPPRCDVSIAVVSGLLLSGVTSSMSQAPRSPGGALVGFWGRGWWCGGEKMHAEEKKAGRPGRGRLAF